MSSSCLLCEICGANFLSQIKSALDEWEDGSGATIQFERRKYEGTYRVALHQLTVLSNEKSDRAQRFAVYRAKLLDTAW